MQIHRPSSDAPRRSLAKLLLAALIVAAVAIPLTAVSRSRPAVAAGERPVFTMYVPLEERDVSRGLFSMAINSTPSNVIVTTIGITAAANGTTLYYDHWEDDYETDIANPVQSTTEVWGDGNAANGAPPGCASNGCDTFNAGAVATLASNVPLPRNASQIRYDGRDKIAATRGVAVTRAGWDNGVGVLHAGAVAASDVSKYGTRFSIPVGVDYRPSFPNAAYAATGAANQSDPFEYTAASIMASHDDTIVQVDFDANGTWDIAVPLDEGQSYFTADNTYTPFKGLRTGARIVSSYPVQVHLMTGDINHDYESRWFEIFPDELLDSEYVAPVSTTVATRPAVIWMHNPNPFPISIEVDVASPNPDVTLTAAARSTVEYTLPLNSGAHISSPNGRFAAVSGIDPYSTTSAQYDWGYSLVPMQALTPGVVIGWAPGKPTPHTATYSPVWVTPTATTNIHVDFDGNGTVDQVIPNVSAYQVVRITDPTDHQMTGARISSSDETLIAAAWGQDTAEAQATAAYDLGITVLPTTTLVATKTARLHTDTDANGELTPGDVVEYTIELMDAGALAITNLVATDPLPPELSYVPGSTARNGVGIVDDNVGSTAFPLDEWGISIPLVSPGGIETFTYRTVVDPNLSPSGDNIRNTIFVESDQSDVTATANINVWFPDLYVTKTASTPGPVLPGEIFEWYVTATNTGSSPQTNVQISDVLPPHVTLLDADLTFTEFNPALSIDVTEDWQAFTYASNPTIWSGSWTESDASQNATAGNVRIVDIDGSRRLEINRPAASGTSEHWIRRTVNTTNAVSGTVSFVYRPVSLDVASDLVAFQVSTDGGTTWTSLDLWWGPLNESSYTPVSYSLDDYLGGNLMFRFWTSFGGTGSADTFYVDNFHVELPARSATTVPAAAAPSFTLGHDIDLYENESVTLRLRAQVAAPLPADVFTLPNTALVASTEVPGPTPASLTLDVWPVSVGDLVWDDLDGDGVRDPGEPGIAGVGVQLAGTDALGNSVTATATTNALGAYLFGGLPPGDYTVAVVSLPSGYVHWRDADGTHDGQISTGSSDWGAEFLTADFALVRPASVSGNVYRDLDADAVLDGGEPALAAVTVTLSGSDGRGNPVSMSTTSAPDGTYAFVTVPGSYTVAVVTASAPQPSTATTAVSAPVTLASGQTVTGVNFGFDVPTGVEITKTLNGGTGMVVAGGTATFTIRVENTGTGTLTGIVVSDPLAPDCDRSIAELPTEAGNDDHRIEYSCSAAGWTGSSNEAGVTATDEWGETVVDDDDAPVTLIAPAIAVTITTLTPQVVHNGTATFVIRVTNTGDTALTGVYVTTGLPDDCDVTGLALAAPTGAPGQTDHYHEYTCELTGVSADVTNNAQAGGLDPNGEPVLPATDSDIVEVLVPALTLTKTTSTPQVANGGVAQFTISVTNTGETDLFGVTVGDVLTPSCATASPIDLPLSAPTASWTCARSAVTNPFTNEATASASDPIGGTVTATPATASVTVINPLIDIQITPSAPVVAMGATVTWTVTVTNTGDTPLANVSIDADRNECDLALTVDPLLPGTGNAITYTCDTPNVVGPTPIAATVTGHDVNNSPVTDTATSATTADPAHLTVTKVAFDGPFSYGADVEFTITITNTSATPLTNLTVVDVLSPDCSRTIPSLAAAPASTSFTCEAPGVVADFTNSVDVTATDTLGDPVGPVNATAPVDVLIPSISVVKSAAVPSVAFGGSVEWTITVTNDGEADLVDVDVVDAEEPTCANTIAFLPADAGTASTVTWTCTSDDLTADITNVAIASATDSAGNTVTSTDNATVVVGEPGYLAGRVWEDIDGDGIQDGGEPGVIGVTVTFHDAHDNQVGLTTTDAGGLYQSPALPPGNYRVRVHTPSGDVVTIRHAGSDAGADSDVDIDGASDEVPVAAGATVRLDAGLYTPAVIGDQVWFDADLDGTFDAGETPAAGVTVTVTWHGLDGVLGTPDDELFNVVTDSNGVWRIETAAPGGWTISVAAPANWQSSPVSITLQSGSVNLDGDVGLTRVPAITRASFTPVCVADIPYIDYEIEVVGTLNTTATLTFTAGDGDIAQVLAGAPLSGRVLYPGASTAPDWPGWVRQGNTWVPDATDADWRNGLDVTVQVNPTATSHVAYPAATEACFAPASSTPTPPVTPTPVTPSDGATVPTTPPAGSDTTATARANELPSTGAEVATIIAIAVAACTLGLVLFGASRRQRNAVG